MQSSQIKILTGRKDTMMGLQYLQNSMIAGKTDYPLVIYLPGNGTIGDGTQSGFSKLANNTEHANLISKADANGFLVLVPQFVPAFNYAYINNIPAQTWQPEWAGGQLVDDVIEWAKANMPVDATRIYLFGYSGGGGGVFSYATRNKIWTNKIACLIPIAGTQLADGDWSLIAACNLPVHAYHAKDDQTILVTATTSQIDFINSFAPVPKALETIYPSGNHWISGTALNDVDYTWVLSQKKAGAFVPVQPTPKQIKQVVTLYSDGSYDIK